VIDAINERGAPGTALKTFKYMRAALRWGVARGDLDHNPIEGMKQPGKEGVKDRVLSAEEIAIVWEHLVTLKPEHAAVLKLALLTGQRLGEVTGMERGEIDLAKAVWIIPASRTKNKTAHSVPLSDAALEIIEQAKSASGERLFPGLNSNVVGKIVAKHQAGLPWWTAHDLRRTLVTHLAELGVAPITLAHIVNHRSATRAGITLNVYNTYDYAREKRQALDLWAERLEGIVSGAAKVINMRA
jgi:integrase